MSIRVHMMGPLDFSAEFIQRFWEKVRKNGAPGFCWEWIASTRRGYGNVSLGEKLIFSHRVSFILATGRTLSSRDWVLHRCDNRACCNPDHLFVGDHAANTADMIAKGRQAFGERNGRAKLTVAEVLDIRDTYSRGGASQRDLATTFGVHQSHIWRIVTGTEWSFV